MSLTCVQCLWPRHLVRQCSDCFWHYITLHLFSVCIWHCLQPSIIFRCLCVLLSSVCVSQPGTPGILVDPRQPFCAIQTHMVVLCVIKRGQKSEILAVYDFMETSYDNGWLVCRVLNRSCEWMTATSVSGVAQTLCGQGNGLFMKCHSRAEVKWELLCVNLSFFFLFLMMSLFSLHLIYIFIDN